MGIEEKGVEEEVAFRAFANDGNLISISFIAVRLTLLFIKVGGCGLFKPLFLNCG